MLNNPATKYTTFPPIGLHNRQWPNQTLTKPPVWLSTDLRDGNQALFEPMNIATKMEFFQRLVQLGFKEIEVGFPSASQTDFDFVRQLIEEQHIPHDVTPMVITQAREDLIQRTVEATQGAKRAIVHLYNATAPIWRQTVFGLSVPEIMSMIHDRVSYLKQLTDQYPDTEWVFQYSPETFSATELTVALEACNTAIQAWQAGPNRPMIINLPTTVENATPNVFADQVEWMHTHLDQREHIILSVHTHNDRGTGIAAAELAQLAGAQRVEGCLFGNGERSGNADLITLALNLYAQGIHPQLNLSELLPLAREVEHWTGIPLHPRHPYAGDLVFTAFSGSHQDAIRKGFAAQQPNQPWQVPYLPIDPADVGRTCDHIIRVNSQSGKGGVAWMMERMHGITLPRRMQIEFSAIVQRHVETSETEMDADTLYQLFKHTYLQTQTSDFKLEHYRIEEHPQGVHIELTTREQDTQRTYQGVGNGPLDATVHALNLPLKITSFEEHALGSGNDAQAIALIEGHLTETPGTWFGVGIHANTTTANIEALLSLIRRVHQANDAPNNWNEIPKDGVSGD